MRREVTTKTVRLLDREQAASHLGMTKGALTMRVYRKQVPFLRVGRRMFFDVEAIDAWIQKQTETAGLTAEEAHSNAATTPRWSLNRGRVL